MPLLVSPDRLPLPPTTRVLFLAGSIEMGRAEDWQSRLAATVLAADPTVVVANPRRVHWDNSWVQHAENPIFRAQVDWELDHLERADLAVFYFQPETLSPVTLMELGVRLTAHPEQTLVCCPPGFWRAGNVQIACLRAGLPMPLSDWESLERSVDAWGKTGSPTRKEGA